ncbi:MAG: hypothetical protein GYA39_03040 [Methanothrix sp.]|nr:hypothetical protein [Methanothrix sp.]
MQILPILPSDATIRVGFLASTSGLKSSFWLPAACIATCCPQALPVYVLGQGQTVRKRGDCLEIWSREGKVSEARLRDVSQVNLYGGVEITTPARSLKMSCPSSKQSTT